MNRFQIRFDDPDQMPAAMGAVATNFSVRPIGRGPFRADLRGARLRDIGLFRIGMTKSEVITDDQLGYFSVTVALPDPFEVLVEGKTKRFADREAYFAHPEDAFNLRMPRPGEALVMNVFKPRLVEYDRARRGGDVEGRSALPTHLQLLPPAGRSFRRFLSFVWGEAQSKSPLLESERAVAELEDALLESLLLSADQEQPDSAECGHEVRWRRAVDYIMANLDGALSVGRIAGATGMHGRTLQRAFRARVGAGVMEYVRDCRLDQAREMLLASDPGGATVTGIAAANGFSHLGRFAAAYARRFGELPSETLGRR